MLRILITIDEQSRGAAMDELLWLRLLGGGFTTGLDVTVLIAFIAFAAIYVIVPVIGYEPYGRGSMLAALWILIGYAALALIQLIVQWVQITDRQRPGAGAFGREEAGVNLFFIFAVLKIVVFLIALVQFVIGLRSIRLRESNSGAYYDEDRPRPFPP